jgi:hypothetical protein
MEKIDKHLKYPRLHDNGKPDERYEVNYEWTGYSTPMLVLRFCDDEFVGYPKGLITARIMAEEHHDKMMGLN